MIVRAASRWEASALREGWQLDPGPVSYPSASDGGCGVRVGAAALACTECGGFVLSCSVFLTLLSQILAFPKVRNEWKTLRMQAGSSISALLKSAANLPVLLLESGFCS